MNTDAKMREDLWSLLHPYDERDIPVAGFPSGEAFIAWVRSAPADVAIDALLDVLREDGVAQQLIAVAALRSLGISVDGVDEQGSFAWRRVDDAGDSTDIVPLYQPDPVAGRTTDAVPIILSRATAGMTPLRRLLEGRRTAA